MAIVMWVNRMSELNSHAPEILINVPIGHFGEGGTVPFTPRYRKRTTGYLDEVQIRAIGKSSSTSATSPTASTPSSLQFGSMESSPPN